MYLLSDFLHRYLSPFLTGASMAATTVVHEAPLIVLFASAAVVFGFMSLPAGGRMIRRLMGTASQN
ncbi:MAG TPA: hypothetical protein VMM59_09605 [Thermohalobaculum sp.]|nr:hypothetical protein [Thermohalobaculum sp.]